MGEQHGCSARVVQAGSFGRSSGCGRNASVFEDGKWWCKQHAPSAVKKRREESDKRINGKLAVMDKIRKKDAAHRRIAQVAIDVTRQKATMDDLVAAVAAWEALG
jgi:hypothetical protein